MSDPTDQLRRYADHIAASVTPARSQIAATRAMAAGSARSTRRFTGKVATVALAGVVVLNVGAMSAANAAVPGDFLYPLDRAYERVADAISIGADRTSERVAEAEVLLERSDPMGALQLLAELDNPDVRGVAATLWNTAGDNPLFASHVTALVANAHEYAAAGRGDERSQAEALAAVRLIGSQVDEVSRNNGNGEPPVHSDTQGTPDHADTQGPPDHAQSDPAATTPDQNPGKAGNHPPDHADTQGPPDHAGDSGSSPGTDGNQGNQGKQGNQDDQGSQGDQGNQGNQGNQGDQGNQGGASQEGPPDQAGQPGPPDTSTSANPDKGKGKGPGSP